MRFMFISEIKGTLYFRTDGYVCFVSSLKRRDANGSVSKYSGQLYQV